MNKARNYDLNIIKKKNKDNRKNNYGLGLIKTKIGNKINREENTNGKHKIGK